MRNKLLITLSGAIALSGLCSARVSAEPPAIKAKKAEARQVLEEIASIDESLNTVSEQYDGARLRLQALRKHLAVERVALAGARARYHRAEQRAARLAVWLYTANHSSSLDVILGARNLGELLRLSDAEHQLSIQAATIAEQTAQAKRVLEARVRALARDRAAAKETVQELASRRAEILAGLAQRRKLLASVQAEVNRLEAIERARQARLAALARARLEAELAARRRAAAAAAAAKRRAALAAAARAKAAADSPAAATPTSTSPGTSPASAAATPVASSTPVTSSTSATSATPATADQAAGAASAATPTPSVVPPVPAPVTSPTPAVMPPIEPVVPSGPLPPGHPEAAQLALAYLGVPYLWGGSTPAGFDCSGLVTYVYAQLGVVLPHFAAAQWGYGVPVPQSELQAGDLVFFDALDHVGIYLGDKLFIDAPHTGAFVRIDSLDEPAYAKKFVGARRL